MKRLLLTVCATLSLAACTAGSPTGMSASGQYHANAANAAPVETAEERSVRNRADYWQRSDSVSAQYMIGPKAQHQLNMDIASCVSQVKELVRLGSIGKATPPTGIAMEPGMREGWTSPTRDGPLFTEYTNFQDFDGCMHNQGWDRVNFVKPVIASGAAQNYTTTILGHPTGWGAGSSSSSSSNTGNNGFNSGDHSFNH